jgi:kynureninase
MRDDLREWRREFPILASTTYMISNSLGAMPRGTADRLAEYAHTWATRGVRAWEEGWWEMPVTVGDMLAPIIGAPSGSVTMHQNVTIAQAIVRSCFRPQGRRKRVVCEVENFPSVMYYYGAQPDLVLHTAPVDELVGEIDERTLLVPISHVLFKSSYVQDVRAVVERAHRVGAYVVLDCFHSAGVLPFSVTELGVDFAVGGCLKWLCGGPGNGWLYVRPDLQTLEPAFTGWQAHEAPFEFAPPPIRRTPGPLRWLNGTPQIPALYAAIEGLRIVREIGVARIRAHNRQLTQRLYEVVKAAGWETITPEDPERRGGTVCANPPHAAAVAQELLARNVIVDYRPDAGIRIAPHFYSTADECDAVMAEIASIVQGRPRLRVTRA